MKVSKHSPANFIVARFDYQATELHELSISRGERLILLDSSREWWLVQNDRSQSGYVPSNYVKRARQNFLSSIRSAVRDVLRRHDNRDRFDINASYSQPSPNIKQQLTSTRSDPNLSCIVRSDDQTYAAFLSREAEPFDRSDWRNASLSAHRCHSVSSSSTGVIQKHGEVAKSHEFESLSRNVFESVANAKSESARFATVVYTYVAQKSDELTLRKGDRVCVYNMCNDGWWRVQYVGTRDQPQAHAKLPLLTRIGWFPSNYLELENGGDGEVDNVLTSVSASSTDHSLNSSGNTIRSATKTETESQSPVADKVWYWGATRRVDCERALTRADGGSFLVRDCESSRGDYTIVVRRRDADCDSSPSIDKKLLCRNFRVHYDASKYTIGMLKFDTLDALLDHYKRHPIFNGEKEKLFLGDPLKQTKSKSKELESRSTFTLGVASPKPIEVPVAQDA